MIVYFNLAVNNRAEHTKANFLVFTFTFYYDFGLVRQYLKSNRLPIWFKQTEWLTKFYNKNKNNKLCQK